MMVTEGHDADLFDEGVEALSFSRASRRGPDFSDNARANLAALRRDPPVRAAVLRDAHQTMLANIPARCSPTPGRRAPRPPTPPGRVGRRGHARVRRAGRHRQAQGPHACFFHRCATARTCRTRNSSRPRSSVRAVGREVAGLRGPGRLRRLALQPAGHGPSTSAYNRRVQAGRQAFDRTPVGSRRPAGPAVVPDELVTVGSTARSSATTALIATTRRPGSSGRSGSGKFF
ncbi:hypothetical protein ACU686_44800, partial [Yinghuangia aomiensis]